MLVAHISDMHLGYSQFGLEEREQDVYEAFEEAIQTSIKEGVKIVILSGDLFHMPKPQGEAIVRFGNALKLLKDKGVKVFFVLGEHDISRIQNVPMPYVFHNLGYAKHLKDGEEAFEIENTLIMGFDKYRKSDVEELQRKLAEADKKAYSFSGHKILVLHQGLNDFSSVSGEINAHDLPKGFTYYAMGHYHDRHEKRFSYLGGPLAYPGSPEITSSEGIREKEKGFYIVDLSGKEPILNWIRLTIRPQMSIDLVYSNLADQIDDFIDQIKNFQKKPIVSLQIKGKEIDSGIISANLSKLNNFVLHYIWQPIEEVKSSLSVYDQRPIDIDAEMFRKTKEVLGTNELAEFAVKELLPLLAENKVDEAFALVWKYYQESKFLPKEVKV